MVDTVKAIITAICLVAGLEAYALYLGIDGKGLAGAIGAITALVAGYTGYKIKEQKVKKTNHK
jgi:hypothetical protein